VLGSILSRPKSLVFSNPFSGSHDERASVRRFLLFLIMLGNVFAAAPRAEAPPEGWSREEAQGKLGRCVQCLGNPNDSLLEWGPNFPGWERSRQPKAVGRPVKVGSKGVIREILPVSEGRYRVVVHWDPEKPGEPYWTTVIGPTDGNVTVASRPPPELIGRWREVGRSATLEFLEDGSFKAKDNEGMAVAGRYVVGEDHKLSFVIHHEGTADEVVTVDFSLLDGELTVIFAGAKEEIERYRKEK